MKTKGLIIFVVLALTILAGAQSVLAQRGSEVAGGGSIFDPYIVSDAPGTRLHGSFGIYYQIYQINPATTPCGDTGPLANMFFTLRLTWGKNNLNVFQGTALGVCYYSQAQQIQAIQDFITNDVIATLFPGKSWKFRSVSDFIDGAVTQTCIAEYASSFFADIVIAVK